MLRNGRLAKLVSLQLKAAADIAALKYFGFSEVRREFQAAERTISSGVAWIEIVMLASRARSSV